MIYPANPVADTWVIASLLTLALILTSRKQHDKTFFSISVTQELKGVAILFVVFAHIGYYLSGDSRFLWPLSNLAGVGVNLFLFLSGYGLTASSLKRTLSIPQFYWKRLRKLYIPFWLTLSLYFLLAYFILHMTYTGSYVTHAFLGIFKTADSHDIDSPLWYFTWIAGYYLVYPLVFIKRLPWLSALIIFAASFMAIYHTRIGLFYTAGFYKVYTVAFPLGIVAAWLHNEKDKLQVVARHALKVSPRQLTGSRAARAKTTLYYLALLGFLGIIVYSRTYSSPWDSPLKEQTVNVLTMLAVVALFTLKRFDMRFFYLFGVFSYEIYLLHWPLMYRYDIFFKHTYAWLAVVLYLGVFILLGWCLSRLPEAFSKHSAQLLSRGQNKNSHR
jgi:peptidoglycan/LPS O-acetylase OafA/YrhL